MPDPRPAPTAAFRDPLVDNVNPPDLMSAFAARLNVVNALTVDGVAQAPREILNYLGELADDFEALEEAIEGWWNAWATERKEGGRP